MILIVGSTKGGVGKTTLAFNFTIALARAGRDVLLVDADKQETASIVTTLRANELGEVGYTAIKLYGEGVIREVPHLAKKYDDVVIDVGGRDNPSLRSAMLIPNATLLIPTTPESFALWGTENTVELVADARASGNTSLRAIGFVNEAEHLHDTDNAAAEDDLRNKNGVIEVPGLRIVARKVFKNAAARGQGVVEFKSPKNPDKMHDPKAISELLAVLSFVHPHFSETGELAYGHSKKA